jgi:hypothetical protein
MKKTKILFFMIAFSLATSSVFSQEAKWTEMENFHSIMSVTFHPAEENNLKPLKEKAAELLAKAKAWHKSTAPEGYIGKVTKPILKKLVKQCKLINESVNQNMSDEALKTMITRAHEIFHEIKEKCKH